MNFSHHRLANESDLAPFRQRMGETEYNAYRHKICQHLVAMTSGDTFDIAKHVASENIELFIKIACLYAASFPGQILFNDEFTVITRTKGSYELD